MDDNGNYAWRNVMRRTNGFFEILVLAWVIMAVLRILEAFR